MIEKFSSDSKMRVRVERTCILVSCYPMVRISGEGVCFPCYFSWLNNGAYGAYKDWWVKDVTIMLDKGIALNVGCDKCKTPYPSARIVLTPDDVINLAMPSEKSNMVSLYFASKIF